MGDMKMKGVQNVSSETYRKPSLVGRGGGLKKKNAKNVLKHIRLLEFLKSRSFLFFFKIFDFGNFASYFQTPWYRFRLRIFLKQCDRKTLRTSLLIVD